VIISAPHKVAVIKDVTKEKALDSIAVEYLQDMDIIFTEGYKRGNKPKVEVFRKEVHKELLCTEDDKLIAVISNKRFDLTVPCFDLDDVKGLADLIEEKFLKTKTSPSVSLILDGTNALLTSSLQEKFITSITEMIELLPEGKNPRSIQIAVKLPSKKNSNKIL
jgi:hypothetical protein